MILCMNQSTIMHVGTEEFIEVSAKAGFNFVELRQPKIEEYLLRNSKDKLLSLTNKLGVKVAALHVLEDFTLVPEENLVFMLKKAEAMLSICSLIDCNLLMVGPSRNIAGITKRKIIELSLKRLQLLSSIAREYGIIIGFEPAGFKDSSIKKIKDGLEIVSLISMENVKLVIDNFHFFAGKNKLDDLKEIPMDEVVMVHISDFEASEGISLSDEDRVVPGEGNFDFDSFFKILKDSGYKGIISVEAFSKKLLEYEPNCIANQCYKYMRMHLD